ADAGRPPDAGLELPPRSADPGQHQGPQWATTVPGVPGRWHRDVGYRFLGVGDADAVGIATPTPGLHLDDSIAPFRIGSALRLGLSEPLAAAKQRRLVPW